jgi:hypothetical protein
LIERSASTARSARHRYFDRFDALRRRVNRRRIRALAASAEATAEASALAAASAASPPQSATADGEGSIDSASGREIAPDLERNAR